MRTLSHCGCQPRLGSAPGDVVVDVATRAAASFGAIVMVTLGSFAVGSAVRHSTDSFFLGVGAGLITRRLALDLLTKPSL